MDEVLKLLEDLEELIDLSKTSIFSSKASVDKDEVFEIITEMRLRLPHELKQAQWVLEERDKVLAEAEEEADEIISQAREKAERIVDEHEITKAAYALSEEIVESSKDVAKEMRLGANEYVSSIISEMQTRLGMVMDINKEQYQMLTSYYTDTLEILHENKMVLSTSYEDEIEIDDEDDINDEDDDD